MTIFYIAAAILYLIVCSTAVQDLLHTVQTTKYNSWGVYLRSKVILSALALVSFAVVVMMVAKAEVI